MLRALLFAWLVSSVFSTRADTLPKPEELLKRVEERLEKSSSDTTNRYFYTRTNIVEELDSNGKVKKRSNKTYIVTLKQGLPRARLIVVDGRVLPESEQKTRTAEEQRLQRAIAQEKNPDYKKPKPWVNEELTSRFVFKVTGRTNLNGRTLFVMTFNPQPDAPSSSMIDKVINKISGELWIDEEEAEIARLELRINDSIKFWGGILGQLDKFDFTMSRQRSPLGVWFNRETIGWIEFRKMLSTSRMKIHEEAFDFSAGEPPKS